MSESRKEAPRGTVVATGQSEPPVDLVEGGARPSDPGIGAAPGAAADELMGVVLSDRYRILRKLGAGGMGSVYLAQHTTINKKLAIKVLSPEFSHKQDLVDRFLQEARAASMIDQENVVEITDFGSTPTGSVYFVMEYLNGEDLAATIRREGRLPWSRVRSILLQICAALGAAHDAGIIHRDMKPENCYRIKRGSNEDFIKVLDFGIAKVTSDEGENGRGLTRTGMIFGTPEYMSPEQAKGERPDIRVDIYAVGVILYELLTGRVPFTADTFMGILTKHMFEAPPAPTSVAPGLELPVEVEAIILKALQKDREYRFQTMREMADAIRAVGTGAAPVVVHPESTIAPASGRIRFSDRDGATVMDGDRETWPEEPQPKRSWTAGIAVGGVLFAAGGAALAYQLFQSTPPVQEPVPPAEPPAKVVAAPAKPPVAKRKPAVADPLPPPPGDHAQPPPPVEVEILVETPGIEAAIVDQRDGARLGTTNAPFTLPHADEAFEVELRADGHEPKTLQILPNADKTFAAELVAVAKPVRSKRTKHRRRTEPEPAAPKHVPPADDGGSKPAKPADHKPSDPPPAKKPTHRPGSPDLKNPFG